MGKEILTFGDTETEKDITYHHKSSTFQKMQILRKSNKISSGEKNSNYLIGYLYDDYKVKLLHIILRKQSACVKGYDEQTKWMYSQIEDDELLEKYNITWDKVSADINKECDSEPIYNKKFSQTKKNYYGNEATDFYDKGIPKVDYNTTFLAVISLDSAFQKNETTICKCL